MKRLILLFAFIVGFSGYSQAEFENLKVTENVQDNAATKVVVQSSNNVLNTVLKSSLKDVIEVTNYASLPTTGVIAKLYVTQDTNKLYRWNGTDYVDVSNTDLTGVELTANKSGTLTASSTLYPNNNAVIAGLATKPSGSGTANQIAFWSSSNTLGSLSTAVYPTISELSNVKGVANPIQTQLNAKIGGTVTGGFIPVAGSGNTISNSPLSINSGTVIQDSATPILISTLNGTEIGNIGGANFFGGGNDYLIRSINNMRFFTVFSEKMRLTTGGNFLINTATDDGTLLNVNGSAKVSSLSISTTPTTSTGTPPVLTRNATTGAVESVPYSTFTSAANAVLLTGNQTINGFKTFVGNQDIDGLRIGSTAGTGSNNLKLGLNLISNTTGSRNVAIALNALNANTTGSDNVGVGVGALQYSNQSNNTAIGSSAGQFIADGSTSLTSATASTFLGSSTKALIDGSVNEIVIGSNSIGAGSNTATLGNTSITKTVLRGVIQQTTYTVATLPTGTLGMFAVVTDALAPTYLGTLVGGGAVKCPVFYNGSAWVPTIDSSDVVRNIVKNAEVGVGVTGTTSETILFSQLIPANTFKDGDFMNLFSRVAKAGGSSTLLQRIRTNTVNSLTDSTLIAANLLTNANQVGHLRRMFSLTNGFLIGLTTIFNSSDDSSNSSAAAQLNIFDPTVDNYIFVTGQLSNGLDQMYNLGTKITN